MIIHNVLDKIDQKIEDITTEELRAYLSTYRE
jgi:hypothetical protein